MARSATPKNGYHAALIEARHIYQHHLLAGDFKSAIATPCTQLRIGRAVQDKLFAGAVDIRTGMKGSSQYLTVFNLAAEIMNSHMDSLSKRSPNGAQAVKALGNLYEHFKAIARGDFSRALCDEVQALHSQSQFDREEVDARVEDIVRYLGTIKIFHAISAETKQKLRRLFRSAGPKPFLYYHWRQQGSHLHLVDFVFLSILRSLKNFGFDPHAIVTERQHPELRHWRQATEAILESEGLTTLEQARLNTQGFSAYAKDYSSPSQLKRIGDHQDDSAETWIPWCPFYAREHRRPGFAEIVWHRRLDYYELRHHIDDFELAVCQLLSGDFSVGEKPLKEQSPNLYATRDAMETWLFGRNPIDVDAELPRLLPYLRNVQPGESSTARAHAAAQVASNWRLRSEQRGMQRSSQRLVEELATLLVMLGMETIGWEREA